MSVFDYDDYRGFLRAFIAERPRRGHGFINQIAVHLNVHASLVSQVLAGKRDFNLEQGHALCALLGVIDLEADYFLLLIERERAGTHGLKSYFSARIKTLKTESLKIKNRIPQARELTDQERSVFYSSWLYSAVRLWTSVGSGQSLDDVAKRFRISRARAQEILQFLTENGLCIQEGEVYRMGSQRTHLDRQSPFISKLHSNWRIQAIQRAENLGEDEMMFTGPLSISAEDFGKVREQIMALIKSVSERVGKSKPEEIACLNVDLFWIKS